MKESMATSWFGARGRAPELKMSRLAVVVMRWDACWVLGAPGMTDRRALAEFEVRTISRGAQGGGR